MGNTLRRLCSEGCVGKDDHAPGPGPAVIYQAAPLGPHGVTVETVGFAALARDLLQFEVTTKVPDGLSKYVESNTAAQIKWYRKLLAAWKTAPPTNAEEAARLILQILHGHQKADLQGFLSFYGLPPSPSATVAVPPPAVVVPAPAALYPQVAVSTGLWPKGVQYELHTLPVGSKAVADGDTLTVYVDTNKDAREAAAVPQAVLEAMEKRRLARVQRDFKTADLLHKEITNAGYNVFDETLTRKYRVRLRGVDAPENSMPYGLEAKNMLLSLVEGHPLHLLVYNVDQYGRIVADLYCKNGFIQEVLLKNGSVWHYTAYDHRPDFAEWEQEARAARIGLWGVNNPQPPWKYRKDNPRIG